MQFSTNSPQSRVQTSGLAPRRSVLLFWCFSYLLLTKVRFIKLKSELDLCLALMGRPGFCSAAAVMENTVFMACILWLTCEIPAFLKLLFFTSTTCPTGVYTMFFFLSVKSCVKNLCRNSHAITYRNLFFCLMIWILKIWVVSGWMRVECSPPFFPPACPKSEVKKNKTPKKPWHRSRQHSWAVTHDRRITLLLTFFRQTCENTALNQMFRLSLWNRRCGETDILDYKRRNCLCYSCSGADVSSGASLRIVSVQTRNICLADLHRAASIMAPPRFFSPCFQISTRKVKSPSGPRSTFTNVFTKTWQNFKPVFSC